MYKNKIIYWGATGQSIVLHEFLCKKFDLIAFIDNNDIKSPIEGIPIYIGKNDFYCWKNLMGFEFDKISFIVAIGGSLGFSDLAFINL